MHCTLTQQYSANIYIPTITSTTTLCTFVLCLYILYIIALYIFYIYIYIYAFSRRFYPKRLTLHSSYSFYILSALAFPGNRTHDLGVANAMLYQLSYRKAIYSVYTAHKSILLFVKCLNVYNVIC